jgi:DNA repair ATPase RecN
MTKQELEARLKKADAELGEAVVVVARCAQGVSDCADNLRLCDAFAVNPEDMVELRNALAHWKKCTQKFLEVVDEVGEFNRAQQDKSATLPEYRR